MIEAFSGPAALPLKVNPTSMIDVMRASLEYFAASSAKSITIPKVTATVTPRPPKEASPALGPSEYTYSDIVLSEIRNGRVGTISIARSTFTSEGITPELGSFAGAMAQISLVDFDAGAVLAMFDPSNVKNDGYQQIYRQATAGPFELRFARGAGFQVDGFTVDEIGVRPSKLSVFSFLAMADSTPPPGTPPTPAQMRTMMDQLANMYEGIRIAKMEMRGLRMNMPPNGNFKLGAMRMTGLENGRLAEFAVEDLDGQSPQRDPVHIGRFALKGLQIANLMRQSSQLGETGRPPSPDQAVGMLALLEGIEFSDVTAKSFAMQQAIRIDTFKLSWGQFIGPIPSTVRLTAKTTVPTSLADMGMGGVLSDAGLATITTSVDFGVAWTEETKTLAIAPMTLELENAFSFTASLSILNVPRSAFSIDPNMAMASADQLEAGPLQFSLRDTGGVSTALAQYAKTKSLSVADARKQIIDSVNEMAKSSQSNPDAAAIAQAMIQFIETPGSTMTISITPKGRVNFKQAFGTGAGDPAAAANLFTIEAKTTR